MPLKFEIYRIIILLLGIGEGLTNLIYLISKRGVTLARNQHKEIPPTVTDKQMKLKIIMLFIFGIIFLICALYSFITKTFPKTIISTVFVCFAVYAVIEASYYRYWKTIGFAVLAISLAIILII